MVYNSGKLAVQISNSGQSENGKDNSNGTDTRREDGRSDLEICSGVIIVVTSGNVGGSDGGGPGASGDTKTRGGRAATGGRKSVIEGGRSVSDTVGRSGDLGLVWHGADSTQRFRRLSVGLDLTTWIGVDAGVVLVVTLAGLESAVFGVVGGVVGTSNTIVNMLAEVSSIGASRVTGLEAEEVPTEEARVGR